MRVVCAWCARGVCVVCAWCVRGVCVVCDYRPWSSVAHAWYMLWYTVAPAHAWYILRCLHPVEQRVSRAVFRAVRHEEERHRGETKHLRGVARGEGCAMVVSVAG